MFIPCARLGVRVLGLRARRADAEDVRQALASASLVDTTRAIIERDGRVIIPLLATPPAHLLDAYECEVLSAEFPKRTVRGDPIDEIRRVAVVPEEIKHLMPPKWEMLGDVLVLRLPSSLNGHEEPVARAYAQVLGAKAVLRDIGGVSGEFRTPRGTFRPKTTTVLASFKARDGWWASGAWPNRSTGANPKASTRSPSHSLTCVLISLFIICLSTCPREEESP